MWTLLVFSGVTQTDISRQSAGMFKNEYWFRVVSVPDMYETSWLDQKQIHWGYCIQILAECNIENVALSNVDIQSFRSEHIHWRDFTELIYWCNGSIMNTDCISYVQDHIYWRDSAVSCKASFDFFITSPMSGNIHQQDYFILIGLHVLHRDLQSTLLKGTVGR